MYQAENQLFHKTIKNCPYCTGTAILDSTLSWQPIQMQSKSDLQTAWWLVYQYIHETMVANMILVWLFQ